MYVLMCNAMYALMYVLKIDAMYVPTNHHHSKQVPANNQHNQQVRQSLQGKTTHTTPFFVLRIKVRWGDVLPSREMRAKVLPFSKYMKSVQLEWSILLD